MKKIIPLFVFLVLGRLVFAQNENAHHQKYWYYKSRLNNSFTKIGMAEVKE